jgi:hypothetical protein
MLESLQQLLMVPLVFHVYLADFAAQRHLCTLFADASTITDEWELFHSASCSSSKKISGDVLSIVYGLWYGLTLAIHSPAGLSMSRQLSLASSFCTASGTWPIGRSTCLLVLQLMQDECQLPDAKLPRSSFMSRVKPATSHIVIH